MQQATKEAMTMYWATGRDGARNGITLLKDSGTSGWEVQKAYDETS